MNGSGIQEERMYFFCSSELEKQAYILGQSAAILLESPVQLHVCNGMNSFSRCG
jgi:hypothetical protein